MEEFLLVTLPHGAGTNGARELALGQSRKRGSCAFRRLWSSAPSVARPALLKSLLMEASSSWDCRTQVTPKIGAFVCSPSGNQSKWELCRPLEDGTELSSLLALFLAGFEVSPGATTCATHTRPL